MPSRPPNDRSHEPTREAGSAVEAERFVVPVHGRAVADIPVAHEEATVERLPIAEDATSPRAVEVAAREEVADVQLRPRRVEEIVLEREDHEKRVDVEETLRSEDIQIHPVGQTARGERSAVMDENRNLERPKVAIVDADRSRNAVGQGVGRGVGNATSMARIGARKLGVGSIVLLVLLALVLVFVLSSIF